MPSGFVYLFSPESPWQGYQGFFVISPLVRSWRSSSMACDGADPGGERRRNGRSFGFTSIDPAAERAGFVHLVLVSSHSRRVFGRFRDRPMVVSISPRVLRGIPRGRQAKKVSIGAERRARTRKGESVSKGCVINGRRRTRRRFRLRRSRSAEKYAGNPRVPPPRAPPPFRRERSRGHR